MTTRKKYTKEFKLDAISLVTDKGYSQAEAARNLGISTSIKIEGKNFKSRLVGKKGVIFFKDYWMRTVDKPGSPIGDHIDLWNGSRLTDWKTWIRIQFGLVIPGVWSDLEKSTKILFWEVKN